MWKGFGIKDLHSQQQGRPWELQTEPGKTGSAKWEEEEEHWGRAVPAFGPLWMKNAALGRLDHPAKESLNHGSWAEA